MVHSAWLRPRRLGPGHQVRSANGLCGGGRGTFLFPIRLALLSAGLTLSPLGSPRPMHPRLVMLEAMPVAGHDKPLPGPQLRNQIAKLNYLLSRRTVRLTYALRNRSMTSTH